MGRAARGRRAAQTLTTSDSGRSARTAAFRLRVLEPLVIITTATIATMAAAMTRIVVTLLPPSRWERTTMVSTSAVTPTARTPRAIHALRRLARGTVAAARRG